MIWWAPFVLESTPWGALLMALLGSAIAIVHAAEETRDKLAEDLGRLTGSKLVSYTPSWRLAWAPACLALWCVWSPMHDPDDSGMWLSLLVGLWFGDATFTHARPAWKGLGWIAGTDSSLLLLLGSPLLAVGLGDRLQWWPIAGGFLTFGLLQPVMRLLK